MLEKISQPSSLTSTGMFATKLRSTYEHDTDLEASVQFDEHVFFSLR